MSDKTNKTRKIKKSILAISSDITSTPEKPKNPAIIARTRKVIIKFNITTTPMEK